MSLVTITAGDVGEYHGSGTPAFARLYANRQFTDTTLVVVAQGSKRKPTFYQEFTCSLVGVNVRVATGDAYSTTDSSVPAADYTLVIYDANGKELYTPFTRLRIPPTPTPTTWDALRIFSTSVPQRYIPQFLTDTAIYALLANIGSAVLVASDVILGKVKLSYAALDLSQPIAVGDNDPIIRGIRKTAYLERYGNSTAGLAAAITAIGSVTPTDLKITDLVTLTGAGATMTVPANIRLVFEGNGGITIASPRTLTINSMQVPSGKQHQLFFGTGNVVLAAGAAGGDIHLEWWAEPGTGTDSSTAIAEVMLSQANGNNVKAGVGTWLLNGWVVPSLSRITGSGMWGGSGTRMGTIFEPYDPVGLIPASQFLIKYSEAFRGGELSNLTLYLGAATGVHALVLEGTYPNSALAAFKASRVAVHGTANAVDQVVVHYLVGASQWECTSIKFEDGLSTTGANTRFFSIDTVNSGPVFKGWEFICSAGATALYFEGTGFTRVVDCQFRGVSTGGPYPDVATLDRNVTGTVITNNAGGNNYLDIIGGGVWEDADIGRKVIRNGATLYITGLELVAGVASRAHLMSDPSVDATQRTSAVYQFTPNTSLAYTAIHIAGSHATINVENCVDEGFQYFVVHEGLQLEYPLNLRGNKPQGYILINNSCNINSDGNDYLSQQFVDGNLSQLTCIVSKGDTISTTSKHLFDGAATITLDEPQLFSGDRGDSTFIQSEDSFLLGLLKSIRELPLQILDRSTASTASTPVLSIATARIIGSGLVSAIQPMLQFARLHPTTKKVDYWYQVGYQYMTGILQFWSNVHGSYKSYRFDAKVIAPIFQTDVVAPSSISSNTNNMSIVDATSGAEGGLVLLNSTGWYQITGFALPTDPATAGFDALTSANYEGRKIEFMYVGSAGVVLMHQSVSSSAVHRFNCDWQDNIALGPQDRAMGIYRNGKWNISLLSRPEKVAMLTSDIVKNNTAALAATTLSVSLNPGRYVIEIDIHTTNAVKSPQFDLNGGTAAASTFQGQWDSNGAAAADSAGLAVSALSTAFSSSLFDGKPTTYRFRGSLIVSTAGTFTVRTAQRTADASNTTLLAGSTIKAIPAVGV